MAPRIGSPAMSLTRRDLLAAGAGTAALAACGGGTKEPRYELFAPFPPRQPAGKSVRLPIGLTDPDGAFVRAIPSGLAVRVISPERKQTASATLDRHIDGLPRGYYPLETTFPSTGTWTIEAQLPGGPQRLSVDVRDAHEFAAVPDTGVPMPRVPSPTTDDHRGVEPICTRDPVCPFHAQSLDQVVGDGRPVALLVSSPGHCKAAICGPVLDVIVNGRDRWVPKGVQVIHAEVYTDNSEKQPAPVVNALGLEYEPALFLVKSDGVVARRLDYIFDIDEVEAAMQTIVS